MHQQQRTNFNKVKTPSSPENLPGSTEILPHIARPRRRYTKVLLPCPWQMVVWGQCYVSLGIPQGEVRRGGKIDIKSSKSLTINGKDIYSKC